MGFLADPLGVITEAVLGAEPQMNRAGVVELVERAVRTRPQQRRLAQALVEAPDLLISGRPEGPVVVQTLIGALLAAGARHVVALRCARCGQQRQLDCRHEGRWVCGSCRQALVPQPGCERCGRSAGDVGGTGGGCPGCDPQAALEEVQAVVAALDPQLPADAVAEAVVAVCRTVRKRGELARDLRADPGLLTGGGARGSAQLVRFIDALLARGAQAVVRPVCPGCGREGVHAPLNGVRLCRSCLSRERREPCRRCGKERPVGSRDADGTAVCRPCNRADPANHEECSRCGRLALIVRRVQHGGLCARCHRAPTAVCSACGRARPCLYATTDHPRCEPCNNLLRETVGCSTCGRELRVETRGPDGQPLCANCARARRHEPCSQCG